jgi:soluble lytic murein transglycosylase-like protein
VVSAQRYLLLFFVLAGTLTWATTPCRADLQSYVKKYKSTSISADALRRLARYDHLIDYFTGFNYFRPNYRVNGDFIRALILAESAAIPNAISAKNAIGLGQIILTTGQQAGRELSLSRTHFRYVSKATLQNITPQDLFDPATNILLTCYLIAKYNHKFNGKIELVVSAWNAGENTESLSFGRHAPYIETQDLIGKVNGYFIYLLRRKGALRY